MAEALKPEAEELPPMEEALTAALQEAEAAEEEAPADDAPADAAPAEEEAPEGSGEAAEEAADAGEAGAPEGDGDDATQSEDAAEGGEQEAAALDAPEHWALEDQETFRGLDPKGQKFLLDQHKKMEAAHTQRSQEVAPLRQLQEQWQPYFDRVAPGANVAQALSGLLNTEYQLRTGTPDQKRMLFMQLAQSYGVTLGAPAEDAGEQDPTQAAIAAAVAPLAQKVQQLQARWQGQHQAQEQARTSSWEAQIQQFRDAKDEGGKLKHPHFDEVLPHMLRLTQAAQAAGEQPNLDDLYAQATWANPDVRAKMLAAERHAEKQKRKAAEKERIAGAKRAGKSVNGAGAGVQDAPKPMEEFIAEQLGAA